MWAYVDSDSNVELHITLPQTWKNISNFSALSNHMSYLHELGWYKVVDTSAPITNDFQQYYGSATYHLDLDQQVVIKNCEILTYDTQALSGERLASSRAVFMNDLRARRDNLLRECDWTQGWDLQTAKGSEWSDAWASYRQQLRDLPHKYSQDPYLNVTDSNQVDWPTRPAG